MKCHSVRNFVAGLLMVAGSLIAAPLLAAEELRKQDPQRTAAQLQLDRQLNELEKRL